VSEQVRRKLKVAMQENASLKAEVDQLVHQVNYWRIEAETDNARWLRCLEDKERLTKAGEELWEFAKLADTNAPKALRKALNDWNAAKGVQS
jgi:hypothetical protein